MLRQQRLAGPEERPDPERSRQSLHSKLHDLRHALASMLVDAEMNPRVVLDLLGRAMVAFTLQTYHHPKEKTAAAAIDQAGRLLGPALG